MQKEKVFCGLDFGSNNSCAKVIRANGVPETVKNKDGEDLTPSVIFYPKDGEKPIVGKVALQMLSDEAGQNVVVGPKRALGCTQSMINKRNLERSFNAEIISKKPGEYIKFNVDQVKYFLINYFAYPIPMY